MKKAPHEPSRPDLPVEVARVAEGHALLVGGRRLRTPAGGEVVAPTPALAERLAEEWRGQTAKPDLARMPLTMPLTRLAFTSIDRGAGARAGLTAEVARYAANDLLCYVAEAPRTLRERQTAQWGPWRDWARGTLELDPPVFTGVMPGDSGAAADLRARELAAGLATFDLVGVVAACGLFGSAILAFALARGELTGVEAHELARLDEIWQESQWGRDAEASAKAQVRSDEAVVLERWFEALRDDAIPAADGLC